MLHPPLHFSGRFNRGVERRPVDYTVDRRVHVPHQRNVLLLITQTCVWSARARLERQQACSSEQRAGEVGGGGPGAGRACPHPSPTARFVTYESGLPSDPPVAMFGANTRVGYQIATALH